INPTTREETLKHEFGDKTALFDIALMLGDAVHNLKCALDYAWMQTIERVAHQSISSHAKFPVRQTVDELKDALEGVKIHVTARDLVTLMLTKIKPCAGGNPAIWPVHHLDI